MGIRSSFARRLAPEAHHLAPRLTTGFVHATVRRAVAGTGPFDGAAEAADKHLEDVLGSVDRAIRAMVQSHATLAAAQGFVTNLGGLTTVPATLPLNIAGIALLQCRMVAGVAHLRGYDITDPRVQNAILVCTLGEDEVKALVRDKTLPGGPMVIATAPAHDPELDGVVAGEVSSRLISGVLGKHAAGQIVRRLPLAGGVWGGSSDGYATWQVGRYAEREFRSRHASAQRPRSRR